jgi:outer membrane lipoprotein-sorting protein
MIIVLLAGCLVAVGPATATGSDKTFTAEQVAESVIFVYGGRQVLAQIRRNGVERGKVSRAGNDGRIEESTYERRFIRGESLAKDKVRIDQKMPSAEYALVYDDGHTWGVVNGAGFTPRQEAAASFLSQLWHSLDALLRYKEDGSTINLVGKEKHKNVEVYVFDLTDKEKHATRYYISAKSLRVLWLEYEETPPGGGTAVKYMRRFYDYRFVQGTWAPYRTVLYEGDKQTQETRVLTITFGVKLEDSLFRNPDTQTTAAQP